MRVPPRIAPLAATMVITGVLAAAIWAGGGPEGNLGWWIALRAAAVVGAAGLLIAVWRQDVAGRRISSGAMKDRKDESPGAGTRNTVTADSVSGVTVQGRDISNRTNTTIHGPATVVSSFLTLNLQGRLGTPAFHTLVAVWAIVFVGATAGVVVTFTPSRQGGGGAAGTGPREVSAPPTPIADVPVDVDDPNIDRNAPADGEYRCLPTGRPGQRVESPSPATVDVWPYACSISAPFGPSFVFPASAGEVEIGKVDSWRREQWAWDQGYEYGYREWAYEHGGVDANWTDVSFSVANDTAERVDILLVDVRVVERSEPLDGAVLLAHGAGLGPPRTLVIDLDDPDAPPRVTAGGMHPEPWNFPLSVDDTVEANDRELFSILATTRRSYVEWVIRVHLLIDNTAQVVEVNDNGSPFRTSAVDPAEHAPSPHASSSGRPR
ncbi:hypothetical protein HNR23_003064 [Nocardiopsis mwathae]|uniref:Uncharacterized protein n=1 Tax=Nocardiopsis mwathae TaxID=1472723 RepID=A0A7W9YIW3_9ACTN|nr:hypothetical protein [Nocardiopsis mwathae]MBB6173004.1 hypothetical protein [Nocardiopsis mwathae]